MRSINAALPRIEHMWYYFFLLFVESPISVESLDQARQAGACFLPPRPQASNDRHRKEVEPLVKSVTQDSADFFVEKLCSSFIFSKRKLNF